MRLFQSTHPLRGATGWHAHMDNVLTISIHAPLAGCDFAVTVDCLHGVISIHAPLAGCDTDATYTLSVPVQFQSTHPLRGATSRQLASTSHLRISIHAPLAGCDSIYRCFHPAEQHFNPRTPCGVRLSSSSANSISKLISIHAPLAGCDSKNTQKIFCIFAITDNKSRKDNVQRRLSERFPYKTGSIYLQK